MAKWEKFAIFILAIAVIGNLIWMVDLSNPTSPYKVEHHPVKAPPEVKKNKPAYDPKKVETFRWKTGSFNRKYIRIDSNHPWLPLTNSWAINRRINTMSHLHQRKMPPIENPLGEVELGIGEQLWKGAWSGKVFVWTDGPKKGYGADLPVPFMQLFIAGKRAFDKPKINWCKGEITSVSLIKKEMVWGFHKKGDSWFNNASPPKEIMNSSLLKALDHLCAIKVDNYIESRFISKTAKPLSQLHFKFKNSKYEVTFLFYPMGVVKVGTNYFVSPSFLESLMQLHKFGKSEG